MKRRSFLFLLFFFPIFLRSQTGNQPIKATDMLRIKSISGVTLNKEGTKAAFTVTSIEPDGESKLDYKYVNQIYLVPTDGSTVAKQLTTKEPASQPAWSPDGKTLALVRAVDGKPQVFLLSLDGGEAVQLTKFKYGAASPKWSPDGKKILFSSNIPLKDLIKDSSLNPSHALPTWPYERPGFMNNDYLKETKAKADPDGSIEE